MKTCFKIHPDDFDKKANEEFYEKMAEEGWMLKKRWYNLSKFEKTEPQKLKFDIYYSEYNYVSEAERQEFNSKGRAIVDVKSYAHVSYSPLSEHFPPVIKSNEDAAEAIIPLKNKSTTRPVSIIFLLLMYILADFRRGDFTYNAFEYLPYSKELIYKIITIPEIFIAFLFVISYDVFLVIYEYVRWKKALKTFQRGENPDDGNRKKVLYICSNIIIMLSIVFIGLFALANSSITEKEVPEFSDGLYLDIHDFGIADKITAKGDTIRGDFYPCRMKNKKTLTADICMTEEYYYIGETRIIIYQDIITYKSAEIAEYAAELLATDKFAYYKEFSVDETDKLYTGGKMYTSDECFIIVIDNTVYRISIITQLEDVFPSTEELLEIIKSKKTADS